MAGSVFIGLDPSNFPINEKTGRRMKVGIHFDYNDDFLLEQTAKGLLGSTETPPADETVSTKVIEVLAPLTFEDEQLGLDLSEMQGDLDGLDARIDTLESTVDTNTTNIGSNASAIGSVSGRVTTIETRIPTPLANYANDAAAAAGGITVGQFYRNGSVVMVRVA